MLEPAKLRAAARNMATPDERRTFEHGSREAVNLVGATIARAVLQPGWRWSTDIKPLIGTESCQVAHTGYIVSGRLHLRLDDGSEYDLAAGDAHVVSPGHDAWVVGDEPCIVLDFAATGNALAGHVGRCPCGVEFRVASDDQLDYLIAAIQQHASGSHEHQATREQVLAALS
jgi:Cupin domain